MKIFLAVMVYLIALVLVAFIAFCVVIVLAGPHSDLLPHPLPGVVLGLGWLAVIVLPFLAARAVWRRPS